MLPKRPRLEVDHSAGSSAKGSRKGEGSGGGVGPSRLAAAPPSTAGPGTNLGFLNEFIHLACAPTLLAMHMYPDCKEITESMAAWCVLTTHGALHTHRALALHASPWILFNTHCTAHPQPSHPCAPKHRYAVYQATPDMPCLLTAPQPPPGSGPRDTIVVVGDGATPRTAAMFALRTSWQVVCVVCATQL